VSACFLQTTVLNGERGTMNTSRMLKKSASFVLASFRPSTYPRGYASGLHSLRPCWTACLSILGERSPVVPHVRTIEVLAYQNSFQHPANDTSTSHRILDRIDTVTSP